MAALIKISGAVSALLALAALLAAGARADEVNVTTAECQGRGTGGRLRLYPTDSAATRLRMDYCNLDQIDPAALTGLPNVITVNLNDNNIESINPAVFHTVPALTTLWLYNNKLRELPVFDERSCANWTWLDLSFNKLRAIDDARTFSACTTLKSLSLHHNGIEFIHPNTFNGLTNLERLYLHNNKIRFVPDQLLGRNYKLTNLSIHNNMITHLPPDFASSQKRAGAGLEDFYFHGNPWHCACLLELLADVQRADVTKYKKFWGDDITRYEGTLPECNYIGMYPCRRDAPSGLLQLAPRAAQGAKIPL